MSIKKTKTVLDFDADSLKEMRKILFEKGLSLQGFFAYILELASTRDERISSIMDEATQQEKGKRRENATDAEEIYQLIERELESRKGGNEDDIDGQTEESD